MYGIVPFWKTREMELGNPNPRAGSQERNAPKLNHPLQFSLRESLASPQDGHGTFGSRSAALRTFTLSAI